MPRDHIRSATNRASFPLQRTGTRMQLLPPSHSLAIQTSIHQLYCLTSPALYLASRSPGNGPRTLTALVHDVRRYPSFVAFLTKEASECHVTTLISATPPHHHHAGASIDITWSDNTRSRCHYLSHVSATSHALMMYIRIDRIPQVLRGRL